MKHSACGGWWEIRTDPQKSEYIVVEGAKKRDYGPEGKGIEGDGDLKFLTEEERERRRNDAFANLEGKMEEKGLEKKNRERVDELYDKSEVWRDPYDVNSRLRRNFRAKRKAWNKEERHKESMQEKFSIGIEIADETEMDRQRAGLIEFGTSETTNDDTTWTWTPLFTEKPTRNVIESCPATKKLRSELAAEKSRNSLQQTLVGNTKAAIDPFISREGGLPQKPSFAILKRKKRDGDSGTDVEIPTSTTKAIVPAQETGTEEFVAKKPPLIPPVLVGYDSD